MLNRRVVCLLLPFALGSVAAARSVAQEYKLGDLQIQHPWARATSPMQKAGGAFLTVNNAGASPDKLLSAASPVAGKVELHTMIMDGSVMRMREVDSIAVPARGRAELKPGGLHVMLIDLKSPLVAGQKVPLTLTFERAGTVAVQVQIEALAAGQPPAPAHKH